MPLLVNSTGDLGCGAAGAATGDTGCGGLARAVVSVGPIYSRVLSSRRACSGTCAALALSGFLSAKPRQCPSAAPTLGA
jgi:hypothetical protein